MNILLGGIKRQYGSQYLSHTYLFQRIIFKAALGKCLIVIGKLNTCSSLAVFLFSTVDHLSWLTETSRRPELSSQQSVGGKW